MRDVNLEWTGGAELDGQSQQPPARRTGLSPRARAQLVDSVPKETWTAYKREWDKFVYWCLAMGVCPLPAASDTVTNWVADQCHLRHSESIIKQGIAAVMFFHDQAPDEEVPKHLYPDTSDAWRLVRVHRQKLLDEGWRPDQAATFTIEQLREMCATLPEGKLSTLRDRAILTAGTSVFARRSALMRIDVDDVTFDADGKATLHITRDKQDQWSRGRDVRLATGQHPMSDPVGALADWVHALKRKGITQGPMFRRISKTGRILDYRLHPCWVGKLMRQVAADAGIEAPSGRRYRAHSLRASGATAALEAGVPLVMVARRGGWSPKGNQVQTYNRPEQHDDSMDGVM